MSKFSFSWWTEIVSATCRRLSLPSTLADDHAGKLRARVQVAQLLSDADIERLRAVLQKATGRQVIVEQEEDASIVGGVVTHIDGRVYDGSIKSQLEVLRARLKQSRA